MPQRSEAEERQRQRLAKSRVLLQAALERSIAIELQRQIDEAAKRGAELARQKRSREEITAGVIAAFLTVPFMVRLRVRVLSVVDAFVAHTGEELGGLTAEARAEATRQAQAWASQYAAQAADDVAQSTARIVIRVVLRSEAQGVAEDQIAEEILIAVSGDKGAARAKRIAGDMAHAVAGNTSNNTASVSNMHILREWVSMEDEKVRPTHVVADGQQVDLDQPFRVGGYFLRFPGDPLGPMQEVAGCRCVALMKRGQKPRVEDVPNWMIGRKL